VMKYRIACLFLGLSSWFKFIGKAMVPKGIVCDVLTLPGYFILDCHIIKQTGLKNGFQWETWLLFDQYIDDMNKLKNKD